MTELKRTGDGEVVRLTFDRPEKMNALSPGILDALERELDAIAADEAVRVVVLAGAGGKAFVAGADIEEYRSGDRDAFNAYQFRSRRIFDRLEQLPKPTIAAVDGYALGGGFEIALCCDIILVSTKARLGLPEGRLGLVPGGGGPQRLLRSIGRHATADLLLSGARLTGQRAFDLGLASAISEADGFDEMVAAKVNAILSIAPLAQAEMKRMLYLGGDASLATALSLDQEILSRVFGTRDAKEGIDAFFEKREPAFRGR